MLNKYKLYFALIGYFATISLWAQDTTQQINPERSNQVAQTQKPYVILISADGFRADMAVKFGATHLLEFSKKGVAANFMRPSYPTITFPNHYSIVTGLYPSHHGLVDNEFFDRATGTTYTMANKQQVADAYWYGGKPLWVLAEEQGMLSASSYWVASESAIRGIRPTYYYNYNTKIGIESRLQAVKDWLQLPEEKRPHFITFYFPEVDYAGHVYGPDAPETREAVQWVDNAIYQLQNIATASGLPVNFVFVSDHGMTNIDPNQVMRLPANIDTSRFRIPGGSALVQLYAKDPTYIQAQYQALKREAVNYDVYLKHEVPKIWHYREKDDRYNRIGDILLVARMPAIFNTGPGKMSPGKHGFDNREIDMHASFYAWGPNVKQGKQIDEFDNVHIYPMIAHILGLAYSEQEIDGKFRVLRKMVKF
ncbi:MAG: alkaline phosphatase family protein [Sediminibacterium sp.]|nr:alkaline phosphatase family protein [Sediminibacterium sp.]